MYSVWFDFSCGDPQRFDFPTVAERNAFLEGVSAAAVGFGIDDYRQFDSEEEVQEYLHSELNR